MSEIWVDIEDYKGYYQVSSLGRVKSLERLIFCKSRKPVLSKERILKPGLSRGYPSINLCKNGTCINNDIHVLVATHFIPNPENKKCVNHKNGIKTDNRVENLEWATYSENTKHAFRIGIQKCKPVLGENHGLSKLKNDDIIRIREIYDKGDISQRELAEQFNVAQGTIGSIIRRKTWKQIK